MTNPGLVTIAAAVALLGTGCSRDGSSATLSGARGPRLCLRESPTIPFAVGDTATLQAGPIDAHDSLCVQPKDALSWQTSAPNVLSVDAKGFARAMAPGRALITVSTGESLRGPARDSATFVVVPPVRDLRIVPDSVTLSLGDSVVFRVVIAGGGDIPVWWYASDAAVSLARPGSKTAPASQTAGSVTVWAAQPGTALLEAGTRYLRDAAHVRVVVR